eukprot:SAG22_NODE_9575_length_581_cov_19.782158_1_plen_60_part_00
MEAPKWYNHGSIECIDAMESAFSRDEIAAFCRINAFKYVWRCTTHKDTKVVQMDRVPFI